MRNVLKLLCESAKNGIRNRGNIDKLDIEPQYEAVGLWFISIILHLMYTIEVLCAYSENQMLYIVAFFANLIFIYFLLGILFSGAYKYYSPCMIKVYKYNLIVFFLELMCLWSMGIIYYHIDNTNRNRCIFTLIVECVFIIAIIMVYRKEHQVLKNIDSIEKNVLKNKYYITCSSEEKDNITKAKQIYNKSFNKLLYISIIILVILRKTNEYFKGYTWIMCVVCIIGFSIFMFIKLKCTFEVIYTQKNKAILINVLCNVMAIVGQILFILVGNKIINVSILNVIGDLSFLILGYMPFQYLYIQKLDSLYKRARCE